MSIAVGARPPCRHHPSPTEACLKTWACPPAAIGMHAANL